MIIKGHNRWQTHEKKHMKNTIFITLLMIALAITKTSHAQVGIGVATANINRLAQLDVTSTTKGFMPPRMNYQERNLLLVTSESAGLIIYCTDCGSNGGGEPEFYNGSAWVSMIGASVSGNLPTLAPTSSIIAIGNESATTGGDILADGGATVCLRGVCWGTSSNPTIRLSTKTVDGTGIGSFTSSIKALTNNTTYYIRSYATNVTGTAYGNEVVFTTLPISSTSSISNLMATTADCGGNISAGGNATITARGVCWSTNSNPTIALSTKTVDGTGMGSFTSSITGLTKITTYYVRSYATNAGGTAYGNEVVFTTPLDPTPRITIGNQVWTTQNLNVSTYRDGTPIPKVEDAATWVSLTYGAYCYYNNDSATYAAVYGKLYNWYAVIDSRGLAPEGYHIPTHAEWVTLATTLGSVDVAGGKMKEAGTSHWTTPNTGANNSSGLSFLPGGLRQSIIFLGINNTGYTWCSTQYSATKGWYRSLLYNEELLRYSGGLREIGMSVRCIKD